MISIIIPAYRERRSLEELHRQIAQVAEREEIDVEIIFVDDGSDDGSWSVIEELTRRDARTKGLCFRRNFGKAAALNAGFKAAIGTAVITLDADLQDDPAEIPALLRKLDSGFDVVSGWKRTRHDPWHKVWPSRVFNSLVSTLTGVSLHDHNCGMKAYRPEVLHELNLYGERHRFIPVLSAARGFRVGEIEVKHRPRRFGRSKYGVSRFVKGLLDLITVKFLVSFGQRPQHVLGVLGLAIFAAGFVTLAYLSGTWIVRLFDVDYLPLSDRPLLIYSIGAMLLGAQMLSIGIVAEMLTAYRRPEQVDYSIAARVGWQRLSPSSTSARRVDLEERAERRTRRGGS